MSPAIICLLKWGIMKTGSLVMKLICCMEMSFVLFYRAIERACRALIAPDKRTNDAVDVRMELDLRIGKEKPLCKIPM